MNRFKPVRSTAIPQRHPFVSADAVFHRIVNLTSAVEALPSPITIAPSVPAFTCHRRQYVSSFSSSMVLVIFKHLWASS